MDSKDLSTSNEDKKTDHQTNEKVIKTSPKVHPSSTVTSHACKSCDVKVKDEPNVTITPNIKASPNDHPSSSTGSTILIFFFHVLKPVTAQTS